MAEAKGQQFAVRVHFFNGLNEPDVHEEKCATFSVGDDGIYLYGLDGVVFFPMSRVIHVEQVKMHEAS
jgi:hypothetical protein